jgi:hypothetical protein
MLKGYQFIQRLPFFILCQLFQQVGGAKINFLFCSNPSKHHHYSFASFVESNYLQASVGDSSVRNDSENGIGIVSF